ncbi:hypothetical protein YC2023_024488 [Brassica napus]
MSSRQRISPTHHGFSDFEPPQTLDMRNENHHFLPLTLVTTTGGLHRLPRKPTAVTQTLTLTLEKPDPKSDHKPLQKSPKTWTHFNRQRKT